MNEIVFSDFFISKRIFFSRPGGINKKMKTAIQHEAEVNSFVYKILDHEFMDESVDFFFDVFLKGRC